jgi:predicted RNA methylase
MAGATQGVGLGAITVTAAGLGASTVVVVEQAPSANVVRARAGRKADIVI